MPSSVTNSKLLIPLCFAIVYLVWGSTYLFISYSLDEIPPFRLMTIRYLSGGTILFALIFLFSSLKNTTKAEIKNAVIAGVLFIGIGSGAIGWVLQYLDTGFTALLISTQPLIIVFMMWYFDKKRPSLQSFLGVALGIVGVYLLTSQKSIVSSPDQWWAVAVVFCCLFVWGYGAIFVSKSKLPTNYMVNTAVQLLSGGIIIFIVSFLMKEPVVDWSTVSSIVYWSMAFLIIFGSIIVFAAFNYLLKHVSPEKVSTSTYVNPVIALILGWWFRDEIVTTQSVIAAAVMLTGVVFINFKWATIKKALGFGKKVESKV